MLLQEGASVPGQTLGGPGPGVLGPTSTHHPTLKLERLHDGNGKFGVSWGRPGACSGVHGGLWGLEQSQGFGGPRGSISRLLQAGSRGSGAHGATALTDQPWPWHRAHQVTAAETRDELDFHLLGARK